MTPPDDYPGQFEEIHERNILPFEWSASLSLELETNDFVEGVLTEGCLAVAYGESGVAKSFWAIDLGLHASAGRKWNERETDQGIVIYISLEGGKLTKNRVIKAREELKLPPNIPFILVTCQLDMRTSDDDAKRLANTIRQAINEWSGQSLPVRLVIIDTMSRALNGGAENAEDMSALLKHTDYVRRETGVAVLFIAHCGKDATRGIRGWSGINRAIDVEIEISKTDRTHVAHVTKERDLPEGDRFEFTLKQVEVGLNSRGRKVTTCVVVHAEAASTTTTAAAAAAAAKAPWPRKLRLFRKSLLNAIAEHGQEFKPWRDGPAVRAVDLEFVRQEFYRGYPAAEASGPKSRSAARRKAFNRAVTAADGLMGVWSPAEEGITFVWDLKSKVNGQGPWPDAPRSPAPDEEKLPDFF
jgi:hypothetical protein